MSEQASTPSMMKISTGLLYNLVEQNRAFSINGRWFVEVEVVYPNGELAQELADKLPEPLPFDAEADLTRPGARDKREPKRGR